MSWNLHVDYICARANARLHYLGLGWVRQGLTSHSTFLHYFKRLKRAGLPTDRLAIRYTSVIRPALEYCAVVLAPRLERSDWGDPEASYSHYLSRDNVYAILGGVAVCWASVCHFQICSTNFTEIFFHKLLNPSTVSHKKLSRFVFVRTSSNFHKFR